MVLDAEGSGVGNVQSFDGPVVEIDVGHDRPTLQALSFHGEAVVLGRDFHLAGDEVPHRLVGTAVAEFHLVGPPTHGSGQNLMAEADAKHRYPAE